MDARSDVDLAGKSFAGGFGYNVADAGDVNNDGYDDVIVGCNQQYYAKGSVYVFTGGPAMDAVADVAISGNTSYEGFGCSVSGAGDVNNDGYDDVVVGAYMNKTYDSNAGAIYIYLGGAPMDANWKSW